MKHSRFLVFSVLRSVAIIPLLVLSIVWWNMVHFMLIIFVLYDLQTIHESKLRYITACTEHHKLTWRVCKANSMRRSRG